MKIAVIVVLALLVPAAAAASDLEIREARGRPAGGESAMRSGDGPAASSALPDVETSPPPYLRTLKRYSFDVGGLPDTQGWSSSDLTEQAGLYWHVDDFAGLPPAYGAITGSRSMWCGVRAGEVTDPAYQYAPGYGDRWMQILKSPSYAAWPAQIVTIEYRLRYYLVSTNSDHLDLECRWVGPGEADWTQLATFTGADMSGSVYSHMAPFPVGTPSSLEFRFVLSTGHLGSDETDADTNGAVILDDIVVAGSIQGLIASESFESGTSSWTAAVADSYFGNYAGLVNGASVVQLDTPNTTHVWSFFNGSTDTYACGGYPAQPVVPKTRKPGSTHIGDYFANAIRSPWIDLSIDEHGQPVAPIHGSVAAEFDVYNDTPYPANGVVYSMRARFMVGGPGGAVQPWQSIGIAYYSNLPAWLHMGLREFGSFLIPPGATHVQVSLYAYDRGFMDPLVGACHSPGPLFDNVRVVRMHDPLLVTNTNDAGPGSLRHAITAANMEPDMNAILFELTGASPYVISPLTPLPAITQPVWIDGFSQAGSSPNSLNTLESNANILVSLSGAALPPGSNGLVIQWGSTVRGLSIGSFSDVGIVIDAPLSYVVGCHVGTDAGGMTAAPNRAGIATTYPAEIGGPLPADRMIISGNLGDGIAFTGSTGFPIRVSRLEGSLVGVAADGSSPLGNGNHGVRMTVGQFGAIGFAGGGMAPCDPARAERNKIAYNVRDGVRVDFNADQVGIAGNVIFGNGGLGIDLGGDGATANDLLDADTGANDLINHPVLTSADAMTVLGSMDAAPYTAYRIEFFRAGTCVSGGVEYMGYAEVATDGTGHGDIAFACGTIPAASRITATAYTTYSGTSEFSPCLLSLNTPAGISSPPLVDSDGVQRGYVTFSNVTTPGNTFVAQTFSPPPVPPEFNIGGTPVFWQVWTTAVYTGSIEVCLYYDEGSIPGEEANLRLLHHDGGAWVDVTSYVEPEEDLICGTVSSLSPFVVAVPVTTTGIGDDQAPDQFALHGAVPNPFNPTTTIHYDVPAGGAMVEIAVFDVSGRRVRTLVDEYRPAGRHSLQWDGRNGGAEHVASGIYFCRMNAGSFVETRKVVLLK